MESDQHLLRLRFPFFSFLSIHTYTLIMLIHNVKLFAVKTFSTNVLFQMFVIQKMPRISIFSILIYFSFFFSSLKLSNKKVNEQFYWIQNGRGWLEQRITRKMLLKSKTNNITWDVFIRYVSHKQVFQFAGCQSFKRPQSWIRWFFFRNKNAWNCGCL